MFEKVWADHEVGDGLLFIDLHLVHEVTSAQAFDGLRLAGRPVRRPDRTLATADHNVPTGRATAPTSCRERQLAALARNCEEFGVPLYPLGHRRQGIVHVIGPELGVTQPGMTIVCGDSHTSTHGAFGALAFGIGTSEVEHVLATQTLVQRRPKTMLIDYRGELGPGCTAKDMILGTIAQIGTDGGAGHVIEYAGDAIRGLLDGGPDDDRQHVDRGRRPGGHDRARRHHLRLPGGPSRRARPTSTRRSRAGGSCDATPAPRSTARSRSTCPHSRRRSRGARTPARWCRSPAPCPSPGGRGPTSARWPTWTCGPGRRSGDRASTACSSARAPTRRIEDLRAAADDRPRPAGRRRRAGHGRAGLDAG